MDNIRQRFGLLRRQLLIFEVLSLNQLNDRIAEKILGFAVIESEAHL